MRLGLSKVGVPGLRRPPAVLEGLRERKIIGERLETLPFELNRYFVRLGVDDRLGRTLATRSDSLVALNWSDLYLKLRKQVPPELYHAGRRVVALEAGKASDPDCTSRTAQRRTST